LFPGLPVVYICFLVHWWDYDLLRLRKKVIVVPFPQHFYGGTEEIHERPVGMVCLLVENRTRDLPNKPE
jgi:hypothetical protein